MQLPPSVEMVAEVIGREQALYLVGQMPRFKNSASGSMRLCIYVPSPSNITEGHELVRILGMADALSLAAAFGGGSLKLANCSGVYRAFRDKAIARMHGEGLKFSEIAELMQLTERHVRNVVKEKSRVDQVADNDNTPARAQKKAATSLRNL